MTSAQIRANEDVQRERDEWNEQAERMYDKYGVTHKAMGYVCGHTAKTMAGWRRAPIKRFNVTMEVMQALMVIILERRLEIEREARELTEDMALARVLFNKAALRDPIFDRKRFASAKHKVQPDAAARDMHKLRLLQRTS